MSWTQAGKLGSRIDDTFLPDLTARRKFAEARVPGLVDLTLAELLGTSTAKLQGRLAGAQVVIVRSQEIDAAGEGGFFQARRTMDTVIDDLARAVKKLSGVGVRNAVVSADHGHLFGHADREEAHARGCARRRHRGPPSALLDRPRRQDACRVRSGSRQPTLGYDSDLDLVVPAGDGVFKAGGDLGFHHGGPTLQELVVPVRDDPHRGARPRQRRRSPRPSRACPRRSRTGSSAPPSSSADPTCRCSAAPRSSSPCWSPAGRQVGRAAMAVGAELDATTGTLTLSPGTPVNVGFMLTDDSVGSMRLVVLDPATDAELYRSPHDIPVNLGVA